MKPLSSPARRLVDALRATQTPSVEAIAAIRAGLDSALVAGAASPPRVERLKLLLGGAMLVGGALVLAPPPTPAAASLSPAPFETPAPAAIEPEPEIAARPTSLGPTSADNHEDAPPQRSARPSVATRRRDKRSPGRAPPSRTQERDAEPSQRRETDRPGVGGELALIRGAQGALRRGKARRALDLADEHRRRFPTGLLAAEAAMIHAKAQCALGNLAQARTEAIRFERERPHSHLVSRVRRICRSVDAPRRTTP